MILKLSIGPLSGFAQCKEEMINSSYFSTAVAVRSMHVNRFAVATYSIMGDACFKLF